MNIDRSGLKNANFILPFFTFSACVFISFFMLVSAASETSYNAEVECAVMAGSSQITAYEYIDPCEMGLRDDRGDLILVNAVEPYDFSQTAELVRLADLRTDGYKVKDNTVLLSERAALALGAMMDDFFAETGFDDVVAVSGYRTEEFQKNLFDVRAAAIGEKEASRWVAAPGASEHHTGLALDFSVYTDTGRTFDFTGRGRLSWFSCNSWKYGFILRYTDEKESITGIADEPWHFRYVGFPHSAVIAQNDMCLEEYHEYLSKFTFYGAHLLAGASGGYYEIYRIDPTECGGLIPVPKNLYYRISGDNKGGYIVTVELNTIY